VPFALNVFENDPLLLAPLSHEPWPVPVVVCVPWAKFHVTVPPTFTLTVMGRKAKFIIVMDAVSGTDVGLGTSGVAVGTGIGVVVGVHVAVGGTCVGVAVGFGVGLGIGLGVGVAGN